MVNPAVLQSRFATTRECTWPGSRCWIAPEDHFRPHPDAPAYTPGIIVAEARRGDLWVQIPHRCAYVDRRALILSQEYRTRQGKWIPESNSRVRPYLLLKLDEARALDGSGHGAMSTRSYFIARYKHALRRNGWFAADLPEDLDD
jgi:hypothetical protein